MFLHANKELFHLVQNSKPTSVNRDSEVLSMLLSDNVVINYQQSLRRILKAFGKTIEVLKFGDDLFGLYLAEKIFCKTVVPWNC